MRSRAVCEVACCVLEYRQEGNGGPDMRCGYCGRKLIDAAVALGYCPSCGTPILRANEMPVGVAMAHGAEAAQLPAPPLAPQPGVPGLTPPPQAQLPDDLRSPYGPVGEAPPPPTAGRMVDALPAAPSPQLSATITQPRGGRGITYVAVLLVLLLLGGGGYTLLRSGVINFPATSTAVSTAVPTPTIIPQSTQTPTPRPTSTPSPTVPSPPADYIRFFSISGVFGLDYPASWSEINQTAGTNTNYIFKSADLNQYVDITESSQPITPRDIVSSLQEFVNNSAGSADFGVIQDATPTTIGANTWTSAQVTFTINNQTQDAIGYAANHGSEGFIIIYSAPTADFQTLPGSNFSEMVSTFTYLR